MKTAQEWLACKPLADANLPAWVRAIQADAINSLNTEHVKNDRLAAIASAMQAMGKWNFQANLLQDLHQEFMRALKQ